MNCGSLYLIVSKSEEEIQDLANERSRGRQPHIPGQESQKAKARRLQMEALEKSDKKETSEGDDAEWLRLNPSLRLPREYSLCGKCGKRGSYIILEGEDATSTEYCKFCCPRKAWKPKFEEESLI